MAWHALGLLAPARTELTQPDRPPTPMRSAGPLVILGLIPRAGLYGRGTRILLTRAGAGHGLSVWQTATFAAGMLALAVALVSPPDALGLALFSAHMEQHLVLVVIAAPLLKLGHRCFHRCGRCRAEPGACWATSGAGPSRCGRPAGC